MKLLHVDSGILGETSVSRKITAAVVERLTQAKPDLTVTHRDLVAAPPAHLTGAYLAGQVAGAPHDAALNHDLVLGAELMEEFLAADVVVVGAPMYNFTIPSQLKAWIDRLLVAGKTFRYTETGPEGLAKGKRVIVGLSRGGIYSGASPMAAFDFQEPYLRAVFGFVGIPDVEFIRAEGVALGPDEREAAIAAALKAAAALPA